MASNSAPIQIVGAGMAGSLLALVLGRAGHEVVVFDPRARATPAFRIEKLDDDQIAILTRLGVLDCFGAVCWPDASDPRAYPDNARPKLADAGAHYADWVAALRAAWPSSVRWVEASVEGVDVQDGQRTLLTSTGERWPGRLLVVATGRSPSLIAALGVERPVLSAGHSVCLGFSVARPGPEPAQILQARFGTGLAYVSIFPTPGELRVNVFSHRELSDPWHRRMSLDPVGALLDLVPQAAPALAGRPVVRRCEARATDLYQASGHERLAATVLIGDAFHAPCPGSGTGLLRILNDVELLAGVYIPAWVQAPEISAEDVARFYADPRKRALDRASLRQSLRGRSHALDRRPYWRTRRALHGVRNALRTAAAQDPR